MSTSISMNIHFAPGKSGHQILRKGKRPKHASPARLPRITRLMALSIKYEHLIQRGLVKTHEEIAELAGVDRSQVSFILRLRLLAPDIQEWILNLPEQDKVRGPINWRGAKRLTSIVSWEEQRQELRQLAPNHFPDPAPKESA